MKKQYGSRCLRHDGYSKHASLHSLAREGLRGTIASHLLLIDSDWEPYAIIIQTLREENHYMPPKYDQICAEGQEVLQGECVQQQSNQLYNPWSKRPKKRHPPHLCRTIQSPTDGQEAAPKHPVANIEQQTQNEKGDIYD